MKNLLLALSLLLILTGCVKTAEKKTIGVSQCSEDIWREKLNRELVIGSYITDNMELSFLSADDNDEKQIGQIKDFINRKVDLLIVAPNSATNLTAVIDSAYDSGIPVIYFDRRTTSEKYTTYVSADNYEVGHTMGTLIAQHLEGRGTVVEITGLKGSSPAIERHRGFADALKAFPDITLVSSALGDWTEKSGEKAMKQILAQHKGHIDCVFGHNDRLAMGARRVAMSRGMKDIKYYGVDALPYKGGGADLVNRGILVASYSYPTQGVEVMRIAQRILNGEKVEKTYKLQSSVIDKTNAQTTINQHIELQRVTDDIEILYKRLDTYFTQVNTQQRVIIVFVIVISLVIALTLLTFRAYVTKHRLNNELRQRSDELQSRNEELQQLYTRLEDMADARLVFFTNVGHKLRTPLTLIAAPAEQLNNDTSLSERQHKMAEMMQRNIATLTHLVDEILDFRKIGTDENYLSDSIETQSGTTDAPQTIPAEGQKTETETTADAEADILVVDDNAEIRSLLYALLSPKYNVTLAANGSEALAAAQRDLPDIIVSDVMMPVMDGLELCRRIKADAATCHIPVVMLTARTLDEQRMEGYTHGADAYITKPFSTPLLLARIDNLLSIRRTLRNVYADKAASPSADISHLASEAETVVAEATQQSADKLAETVTQPHIDIRDSNFITRLRDTIQANLADPELSVERIGEEIGMSRVQLYRKTKALTGMSPVELIRRSRLEKGKKLLTVTDKTISEIAYAVGFNAPSYFTKCFKDEYGISPGEERERNTPECDEV